MKTNYQTFPNQNENVSAGIETFNNLIAMNGLCERDTVRHLQVTVKEMFPQTFSLAALDLSAGRGVAAMTLAQLGFNVVAYDMYRNSIAILQRIALQQDLNISFGMGGIFELKNLGKKFDLIHDGQCLTEMVQPSERAQFLASVKEVLAEGGTFVITSRVQSKNFDPADSFESVRMDENHVLWRQTPECGIPGVVELDGKHWVAQKYIPTAEALRQELLAAGFDIVIDEVEVLPGNNPANMRVVLSSVKERLAA